MEAFNCFFVKLWYILSYCLHFESIRPRLFAAYLCDKISNLIGIFYLCFFMHELKCTLISQEVWPQNKEVSREGKPLR